MINRKRVLCALLLIFFVAGSGLAFAQGTKKTAYTGAEGKITVYLSGPEQMLRQLEAAFEATRGDVLDFVIMGCGPLRQRVWTEYESGQIKADVFWGSDPLIYLTLDKKGALEAYTPKGRENLKSQYRTSSSAHYTLVNERYGVVIYNSEKLKGNSIPTAFGDLTKPVYRDALVHSDPDQSSTGLALLCGLWEAQGRTWSFHKGLAGNGLFLAKKNSDVPSKIMEGEFNIGIAPHDEAVRIIAKAKKEGYPSALAICWPKEGALAVQRPVAISLNTARPKVNSRIAHDFVDFLISEQAQKITSQFGFVSVRSDVPAPAGIPRDLKVIHVDWEYLASHDEELRAEFKALF